MARSRRIDTESVLQRSDQNTYSYPFIMVLYFDPKKCKIAGDEVNAINPKDVQLHPFSMMILEASSALDSFENHVYGALT